jgi:hypothetical protein
VLTFLADSPRSGSCETAFANQTLRSVELD